MHDCLFQRFGHLKLLTKAKRQSLVAIFCWTRTTTRHKSRRLKKVIKEAALDAFKGQIPNGLNTCLGDGNSKSYDGYENAMFISCASRLRPQIIDRDRTPLVEEDGRPYAGCYVNAAISLWVMDNKWGKRVACNLNALQFSKDGDTFGAGGISDQKTVFPR